MNGPVRVSHNMDMQLSCQPSPATRSFKKFTGSFDCGVLSRTITPRTLLSKRSADVSPQLSVKSRTMATSRPLFSRTRPTFNYLPQKDIDSLTRPKGNCQGYGIFKEVLEYCPSPGDESLDKQPLVSPLFNNSLGHHKQTYKHKKYKLVGSCDISRQEEKPSMSLLLNSNIQDSIVIDEAAFRQLQKGASGDSKVLKPILNKARSSLQDALCSEPPTPRTAKKVCFSPNRVSIIFQRDEEELCSDVNALQQPG